MISDSTTAPFCADSGPIAGFVEGDRSDLTGCAARRQTMPCEQAMRQWWIAGVRDEDDRVGRV